MLKFILACVCSAFFLAGCGGGGGSSGPVASTSAFPLRQININSLVAATRNYSLSGTISAVQVTGSGTETDSSLTAGSFEGISGFQQATSNAGAWILNGSSTSISSSEIDWYDSNYNPTGISGGSEYIVVDQPSIQLPVSAYVNDSGTWLTAKRYSDSTKASLNGTLTMTYKLDADTTASAVLSLIRVDRNNAGVVVSTDTKVIRITPTGSQKLLTDTETDASSSLVVTYQ